MNDEEALHAYLARERDAVNAGVESVKRLETFRDRPQVERGETWIGWLWPLTRKPLSKEIAEVKLRADIYTVGRKIRRRLWTMPHLNAARCGVLLHVGLLIGADEILRINELWAALQNQDYESAHDLLLSTRWPALAGDDPAERRRVLAMARQLRTGVAPC